MSENLVLEQLRLIRKQIDDFRDEVRGYKAEMVAMCHYQRGSDVRLEHHTEDLVPLHTRVDRIERRLQLADDK
jgi:hypothetical protein